MWIPAKKPFTSSHQSTVKYQKFRRAIHSLRLMIAYGVTTTVSSRKNASAQTWTNFAGRLGHRSSTASITRRRTSRMTIAGR